MFLVSGRQGPDPQSLEVDFRERKTRHTSNYFRYTCRLELRRVGGQSKRQGQERTNNNEDERCESYVLFSLAAAYRHGLYHDDCGVVGRMVPSRRLRYGEIGNQDPSCRCDNQVHGPSHRTPGDFTKWPRAEIGGRLDLRRCMGVWLLTAAVQAGRACARLQDRRNSASFISSQARPSTYGSTLTTVKKNWVVA